MIAVTDGSHTPSSVRSLTGSAGANSPRASVLYGNVRGFAAICDSWPSVSVEVECAGVLGDVEDLGPLALAGVKSLKKAVPCLSILDNGMVNYRYPPTSIVV
jgi:hypothetical protein